MLHALIKQNHNSSKPNLNFKIKCLFLARTRRKPEMSPISLADDLFSKALSSCLQTLLECVHAWYEIECPDVTRLLRLVFLFPRALNVVVVLSHPRSFSPSQSEVRLQEELLTVIGFGFSESARRLLLLMLLKNNMS